MKRGMEFITLLAEFFDSYLPDTKGVSKNTIRSYKAALRLFFTFLSFWGVIFTEIPQAMSIMACCIGYFNTVGR